MKTFSVRHFLPFTKKFATVGPVQRTRPPFLGSAFALRIQEPRHLVRAAAGPLTAASARKGSPLEVLTYSSDALSTKSREVLEIASGVGPDLALSKHGPWLVGGTVTLDDISFTIEVAYISRGRGAGIL